MHFAKNNVNCKILSVLIAKRTIKKLNTGTLEHIGPISELGNLFRGLTIGQVSALQYNPVLCSLNTNVDQQWGWHWY